MKIIKTRFAAVLLVCVMLLGLFAGCNSTESASGKESTPTSTPADSSAESKGNETAGESDPVDATGMVPFTDRVEITIPVYDRSKEGYPAVDNNYWTKWIQQEFGESYNVGVKYMAIPRGDVMTKYSMLIAAGDTPTILMEYDYPKVAQWANDGAMATIDMDDFAVAAPTFYGKMVENNQLQYTDLNDETYFVLTERPYYDTAFVYADFVRMDWLEAVGYTEVPKSYEEMQDAVTKIMGQGLTDQAPVGLSLPVAAYVGNFAFRDFPANEKEWALHSSLGTASLSWEPTYKLLKRQNAEYNAGWYSKEYEIESTGGAGDSSQMQTDFINGKIFKYGGYLSTDVSWLNAFYENNPEAKLAVASIYANEEPGVVERTQLRAENPFGMIVGFSSFASEEQLKAAWMFIEWMSDPDILFTLENGIEGVTYTLDDKGFPIVDTEYRGEEMLNHNSNIDMTCLIHASKKIGTVEETIGLISPQGLPQDFTQEIIGQYKEQREVADTGRAYSDPVFAVTIGAEAEYSGSLLALYQEYSVALTKTDSSNFDALYEELSQKYLEAGYQEIIDEREAAYSKDVTTKLPEASK